jgi:hypothetical protein
MLRAIRKMAGKKHVKRAIILSLLVGASVAGTWKERGTGSVRADSVLTATQNVTNVPHRPDITIEALPSGSGVVSLSRAVHGAETGSGISDRALDTLTPAVPALVTLRGNREHQSEKVWIITANYDIRGPGNGVLYHKVCIVVSGTTGQYEYAYAADPEPGA